LSRFTFIASNCELAEIDLSGIVKLTIKELKGMNPRPESFWNLDELPDDCEGLIIPDDADAGGLQISGCTNPPDGLEEYIKKKYIYWLGGEFDLRCKRQLKEYLQNNIKKGTFIEFWSLWFGNDKMDQIIHRECKFSDISSFDFEMLWKTDCCITLY